MRARTELPFHSPNLTPQGRAKVSIEPFVPSDEPDLFAAYAEVVAAGGAFPRRPPADRATFRTAWIETSTAVSVARVGQNIVGGYFIKQNFPGLAAHIANAGYLVAHEFRGQGIGRALAEHSLKDAHRHGFDAMMFNLVMENNPSRRLWANLGFREIGRIPDAVDGQAALMYWRPLP